MGQRVVGEAVLLRGVISDDGRSVLVGPGIELAAGSVKIVAGVPTDVPGECGIVMFFDNEVDRHYFAEQFLASPVGMSDLDIDE